MPDVSSVPTPVLATQDHDAAYARIQEKLLAIYDAPTTETLYKGIQEIIQRHINSTSAAERVATPLSENDMILITYGDQFAVNRPATENPLQTFKRFNALMQQAIAGSIGVHFLPFFPYSSDDGFSVQDYSRINPEFGDWNDVRSISTQSSLMFDFVCNHASKQHEWFKAFLANDPNYAGFFTEKENGVDYRMVTRPRPWPLFHAYYLDEAGQVVVVPGTTEAEIEANIAQLPTDKRTTVKQVWTTFSDDQVDLNFRNPALVLKMVETLLDYARHGAKFIRLDAVGFIWKAINAQQQASTCIHETECHKLVQVLREIVDIAAPQTRLVTETNVPHAENIAYFGDESNPEASMVYNFALPPLTLHAFLSGDASPLLGWARTLDYPANDATFFNFTASHDGIGVRASEKILTPQDIQHIADAVLQKDGRINYRTMPDGTKSPYELNISFLNAIAPQNASTEEKAKAFLASQAIMLALKGVPGIYIHSLLGSENDLMGRQKAEEAGENPSTINRRINREKLDLARVEQELADPTSLRSLVFTGYTQLIQQRKNHPAFSPQTDQQILELDNSAIVPILRTDAQTGQRILALTNVSGQKQSIQLPTPLSTKAAQDILSDTRIDCSQSVTLGAYQVLWLQLA
mgnify:CR=1 FL=1